MVSKSYSKKQNTVKVDWKVDESRATSKGGLAIVEALASRLRLWSDLERLLPPRRDCSQGYDFVVVLCAIMYGLLSGGRGFSCVESLRGDTPLETLMGIDQVPSAETAEAMVKYLAEHDGHEKLCTVGQRQVARLIDRENRSDLLSRDGFLHVWGDGSLLETKGKNRDALLYIKKKLGQNVSAVFVGPYLHGTDFSRPNPEKKKDDGTLSCDGELTVTLKLLSKAGNELHGMGLMQDVLVLLDSLYGNATTLDQLDEEFAQGHHIVGVNDLKKKDTVLSDRGPKEWTDTTRHTRHRNWDESAVATCWLQCDDWKTKRLMIGRRWKKKGEMIYNYAGVVTNLTEDDPRVAAKMKRENICFEEAIWRLYDSKQALENRWKDLLIDMGLHHPPCAKSAVNAVFFQIAALAYNLQVAVRRLCMKKDTWTMRLSGFRRDFIDVAARVVRHARTVVVWLLDARERLVTEFIHGMGRLADL